MGYQTWSAKIQSMGYKTRWTGRQCNIDNQTCWTPQTIHIIQKNVGHSWRQLTDNRTWWVTILFGQGENPWSTKLSGQGENPWINQLNGQEDNEQVTKLVGKKVNSWVKVVRVMVFNATFNNILIILCQVQSRSIKIKTCI